MILFLSKIVLICVFFGNSISGTLRSDEKNYHRDLSTGNSILHAKRCHPTIEKSDESSGCASSEETTKFITPRILSSTTTSKPIIVLPKGPFYDFVVNICQTLLKRFSEKRIPGYFKILNKSLKSLAYEYSMKRNLNKFRDKLKKLSDFNGHMLKKHVLYFLKVISSGNPVTNEFFYAMNALYSMSDDGIMNDYIYFLKRFGEGDSRHIGQKTRRIFQSLVFHRFHKSEEHVRDDVTIKLTRAVIDYMEKNKDMYTFTKYVCATVILKSVLCYQVIGIVQQDRFDDYGRPVVVPITQYGINFETFIREMLDLLSNTTYSGLRLTRYARVLSRELDKFNSTRTLELAEDFRRMSRMFRDDLKDEMAWYRRLMDYKHGGKPNPYRELFFYNMNRLLGARMQFKNYINDVRDYGYEKKEFIDPETGNILSTIFKTVQQLQPEDQAKLESIFIGMLGEAPRRPKRNFRYIVNDK